MTKIYLDRNVEDVNITTPADTELLVWDEATQHWVNAGMTIIDHNALAGLEGGAAGEYYHLTKSSMDYLTSGATVDATSQHNHSFSTLLDVENPTTSNNFFYWDNVNKIVKNVSIKEYLSIYDLNDVYVTGGATTGQVLTLVGSSWHNEALPTATDSAKGIVELATSAETTAGLAVQASDTRLSDARTPTAHNILNSTYHGDTLTGSVTRGDIIYGNSTPKWARLAKGTSGYVLTAGASDIGWAAIPNATTTAKGIVELATDGENAANVAVQGNDSRINDGIWTFLTTPLTSTNWDGDARSTTPVTKIDLSSVFSGYPTSAVKAVLVRLLANDSATLGTTGLSVNIGPSATYYAAVKLCVIGGDVLTSQTAICPCDPNGDIYYQIVASGTGTMDVRLEIWGYCV